MPDLGLDISSLTKPGRKPSKATAEFGRQLTLEDLPRIAEARGTGPAEIKRITQRHHALARLLALGIPDGEAGAMVGYQAPWVSSLKRSPAFRELTDLYREKKDAEFVDTAAQLAGLSQDAIMLLRERLEDEEKRDEISIGQALEIAKFAADRTGLGPTTKSEQSVTVNIAERIEAGRRRAKELSRPAVEDAIVVNPDD